MRPARFKLSDPVAPLCSVILGLNLGGKRQARQVDEHGFSIVEMLVSLMILGLLGGAMSTFLVQLRPLDERTEKRIYDLSVKAVGSYFTTTVSGALNTPFEIRRGKAPVVFVGDRTGIQFVGVIRTSSNHSGLRRVALTLTEDENGDRQLLQQTDYLLRYGQDAVRSEEKTVLQVGLKSIVFRFKGLNNPEWSDSWSDETRLPRAVEMTMIWTGTNTQRSRTFIATLSNAGE